MRTWVTTTIECESKGIGPIIARSEGDYRVVPDEVSYEDAAEQLGCSPALVEFICDALDVVRDCISSDLESIWRRLDEAGIK